jgi:hypothetical protein
MNTTLGEKLRKAGYLPREVRFSIALSEFLNNGGTIERAHALVDQAAEQMQGKGQVLHAAEAFLPVPDALQTHGDKGLTADAAKARSAMPASPNTLEKGQEIAADEATDELPVSSTHPPEQGQAAFVDKATAGVPRSGGPGISRRGLAAIASVQGTIARSLFERTRLPDGRTLREVRWSELPRLAREYRSLSRVFTAIYKHAVPSDPSVTIDLIVKESELQEILTNVERFNDIH